MKVIMYFGFVCFWIFLFSLVVECKYFMYLFFCFIFKILMLRFFMLCMLFDYSLFYFFLLICLFYVCFKGRCCVLIFDYKIVLILMLFLNVCLFYIFIFKNKYCVYGEVS